MRLRNAPCMPNAPATPTLNLPHHIHVLCQQGAGNDYQKDLQFRKLNAVKDTIDIKVLRGKVRQHMAVGDMWREGSKAAGWRARRWDSSGRAENEHLHGWP